MKLYVESILANDGQFRDLFDWQKHRIDRNSLCTNLSKYMLENFEIENKDDFAQSMNEVYLNDFRHIFYCVIFATELIKHTPECKTSFPCSIDQITASLDSLWSKALTDRLKRDIMKLQPCIMMIVEDANIKATKKTIAMALKQETDEKPPREHSETKQKKKEKANLELYALEDNLLFVIPFIALKLLAYPITAKSFIDIILEHPKETMVNTLTEDYKGLLGDLHSQLLSFKLNMSPGTLHNYQFKFIEFTFDNSEYLAKFFPELYNQRSPHLYYPATYYLKLMKQIFYRLRMPRPLSQISNIIFCGLLASNPEFIKEREELACLGVCFFLLKSFYGLGLNSPPLATITKNQVTKQIEDSEQRAEVFKCLEFISNFKSDCKLHEISRSLPSFEQLLDHWFTIYTKLKKHHDVPCVYPQTQEEQANLTQTQVVSVIESLGSLLLSGVKTAKSSIPDKPRGKEKPKRNPNSIKVEVEYPERSGAYVLKEEVRQEVDFIMKCSQMEFSENVELPHPSDVYVKFKQSGSIPIDDYTEDILIIYELFTEISGQYKEIVIPALEKCEKFILQLIKAES